MRYVLGFALLMALLTTHVRSADFAVVNNCPRFTVTNNTATVVRSSTCNCGTSGRCLCWEEECRCAACGRGGAAAGPKARALSATTGTAAPRADTSLPPVKAPGLSGPSPAPSTSTSAPGVYQLGGTDCASGNCPSAASQRRGLIFRR